jgi:hypothetical protein
LHYDEKWFWGFVGRGNAKMAPSAGINKSTKLLDLMLEHPTNPSLH